MRFKLQIEIRKIEWGMRSDATYARYYLIYT